MVSRLLAVALVAIACFGHRSNGHIRIDFNAMHSRVLQAAEQQRMDELSAKDKEMVLLLETKNKEIEDLTASKVISLHCGTGLPLCYMKWYESARDRHLVVRGSQPVLVCVVRSTAQ
mgnify:FL=1